MRPSAKRLITHAVVSVGFTAICAMLIVSGWHRLLEIESYSEDLRLQFGRKVPADSRLVFVGIDQSSYDSYYSDEEKRQDPSLALISKNWPWSREVWAIAIERLINAGAKVVALDLILTNPDQGDEQLRTVVEKYRNRVVLGANVIDARSDRGSYAVLQFPSSTIINPSAGHPMQDPRVGYVNLESDAGDVIRRVEFHRTGDLTSVLPPGVEAESLTARILRHAGMPEILPKEETAKRFRYTARPGEGYRMLPISQILDRKIWEANYLRQEAFKNKIVLIGPAAKIFHDEHRTPFHQNMLGPEIHLNILAAALQADFLEEASPTTDFLLTSWAGLVGWLLIWRFPRLFQRFVMAGLVLGLYLLTSQLLYDRTNVYIAIVAPSAALLSTTLMGLVYDFAQARRDKAQLRRTLERYVAKDVVRELIDNPQTYLNSLTGVRKPVTVFFSDIRGFTTLTEATNAAALVKQLNEYFQEMVGIVVKNRGRLDKFIGDAVMADWGSFVSAGVQADAERAVLSALQMRDSLKLLNHRWQSQGMQTLAFGIGINHGEVIVGNLGSEEKMEVSVIGDAVNLASRLESLTKEYHLDLLLGDSLESLVRERFTLRSVDLVRVKGKTQPVAVFTVPKEAGNAKVSLPWLELYEEGVRLYRSQSFPEAQTAFQKADSLQEKDPLILLYLDRCEHLIASPPSPGWTGVFEMTKK